MVLSFEVFGISDVGLRKNNEDAWAELPENHFYILADGLGGHLAGEVASKETVLHFCDAVDKYFRSSNPPTISSAKLYLGETFISANSWIRRLGKDHPDLHGMGTTVCCLLILQNVAIIGHIGDSRVYRFRKNLDQLTVDHTLEQEQLSKPLLKKSSRSSKHILTRAIGISPAIEPELQEFPCEPGDIYLLSSDGLHDVLSNRQIETIFRSSSALKSIGSSLIDEAKKNGSKDNITAALIKINSSEWWDL
jgi:protein phosphatase